MSSYQHYLDACTEAYFRGISMDSINIDRAENDYYNGRSPEYTAEREVLHQRQEREERQMREQRELDEYYEQVSQQEQQQYYQSQQQEFDELTQT